MEEAIKQAFVVGLGELNTSKARSQHGSIRKEQIEIDKLVIIVFQLLLIPPHPASVGNGRA